MIPVDTNKTRLYFENGRVQHYENQKMAYAVCLGFPKGIRVAFRGTGDTSPVYSHDYVDVP